MLCTYFVPKKNLLISCMLGKRHFYMPVVLVHQFSTVDRSHQKRSIISPLTPPFKPSVVNPSCIHYSSPGQLTPRMKLSNSAVKRVWLMIMREKLETSGMSCLLPLPKRATWTGKWSPDGAHCQHQFCHLGNPQQSHQHLSLNKVLQLKKRLSKNCWWLCKYTQNFEDRDFLFLRSSPVFVIVLCTQNLPVPLNPCVIKYSCSVIYHQFLETVMCS